MLTVKRDWQLQAAKARLSALVDDALSDGPQRITRHGKAAAVVLSEGDFQRLNGRRVESLLDLLARSGFDQLDLERDPDVGRDIEL